MFAASRRWTNAELEEFGRRHARGLEWADDLAARLLEEADDPDTE